MLTFQNYVAGWIDSSVSTFFEDFPKRSSELKYALIIMLDSDPRPASMLAKRDVLLGIRQHATKPGSGILLSTAALLKNDAYRDVFFGFDEVWFFPEPPVQPRPLKVSFVGPRHIEQTWLDQAGPWMAAQSCALAIADGDGMNYVVKARGLVKYLLGHSSSSPLAASASGRS